ncbi:hypothetical protein TWF696_005613 [Orbilia brochopaga]|uniref:Uncharacterized protein n=1 Tax=Orbilia brochopaga TaxID=3140254 RepID=A0AAV9V1B3_9PEZI
MPSRPVLPLVPVPDIRVMASSVVGANPAQAIFPQYVGNHHHHHNHHHQNRFPSPSHAPPPTSLQSFHQPSNHPSLPAQNIARQAMGIPPTTASVPGSNRIPVQGPAVAAPPQLPPSFTVPHTQSPAYRHLQHYRHLTPARPAPAPRTAASSPAIPVRDTKSATAIPSATASSASASKNRPQSTAGAISNQKAPPPAARAPSTAVASSKTIIPSKGNSSAPRKPSAESTSSTVQSLKPATSSGPPTAKGLKRQRAVSNSQSASKPEPPTKKVKKIIPPTLEAPSGYKLPPRGSLFQQRARNAPVYAHCYDKTRRKKLSGYPADYFPQPLQHLKPPASNPKPGMESTSSSSSDTPHSASVDEQSSSSAEQSQQRTSAGSESSSESESDSGSATAASPTHTTPASGAHSNTNTGSYSTGSNRVMAAILAAPVPDFADMVKQADEELKDMKPLEKKLIKLLGKRYLPPVDSPQDETEGNEPPAKKPRVDSRNDALFLLKLHEMRREAEASGLRPKSTAPEALDLTLPVMDHADSLPRVNVETPVGGNTGSTNKPDDNDSDFIDEEPGNALRELWASTVPSSRDLMLDHMSLKEMEELEKQAEDAFKLEDWFDYQKYYNDTPEQVAAGMIQRQPEPEKKEKKPTSISDLMSINNGKPISKD